jgi:hypothetical protein
MDKVAPYIELQCQTLYMVNEEYPKLDPSKPRATSVNCCAASRVFFRERDLIRECMF